MPTTSVLLEVTDSVVLMGELALSSIQIGRRWQKTQDEGKIHLLLFLHHPPFSISCIVPVTNRPAMVALGTRGGSF